MIANNVDIEELRLVLSVKQVAEILGVSVPFCYELFRTKGFPSIRILKRWVVRKDQFFKWLDNQIEIQNNADWKE